MGLKITALFLTLALLLIACSAEEIVQQTNNTQETFNQMREDTLEQRNQLISTLNATLENTRQEFSELQARLQERERFIEQQRTVLREADNRRAQAESDYEELKERIKELEENNERLGRMVAICQEELTS